MAEDPEVPLLERLRFLSIFARNMDEFFVVRVARFKEDAARGQAERDDHFSPAQLSDLVAIRVRALSARQYWCFNQILMPALAEHDVRIRVWRDLDAGQRSSLAIRFSDEIFPVLTPLRMSTSSVRSFPRLVSLGLALAAVLRRPDEGRPDLGYVAIPGDLPRFLQVPDSNDFHCGRGGDQGQRQGAVLSRGSRRVRVPGEPHGRRGDRRGLVGIAPGSDGR